MYNREKVELFQIAGKFYIVKLLGNIFQAKFSTQSFMPEKGFFLRVDRMVRAVTQNKKNGNFGAVSCHRFYPMLTKLSDPRTITLQRGYFPFFIDDKNPCLGSNFINIHASENYPESRLHETAP